MFCKNCGTQLKEGAKFCPKSTMQRYLDILVVLTGSRVFVILMG